MPKAVAIADVNGDGAVDVLTANTAGNGEDASGIPDGDNVSVLLGNGAGSLGAQTKTTVGPTPFSLTVADLDADGRRDLVTANWHGDEAAVLRNVGATVRDTAPPGVTATAPVAGATGVAADANVTAAFSEPVTSVTGWNVQLLRSGTSTVVSAALYVRRGKPDCNRQPDGQPRGRRDVHSDRARWPGRRHRSRRQRAPRRPRLELHGCRR